MRPSIILSALATKLCLTSVTTKTCKIFLPLLFTLLCLVGFSPAKVNAQAPGDYRSIIVPTTTPITTVNWEAASTWEVYIAVAGWQAASSAPDFNAGVITVRTPTYIKTNSNLTIDQTIVENGATIQPTATGTTLTINNGAGTDLQLNGVNSTVWANNCLLNVTSGALIDGPTSSMQYRGLTLINNGTINATLNPRPDVTSTTISGTGTIGTLTTSNNGGLFLAGEQTITSLLNFNFGNVITGANKLILAASATVQNNSLTDWYVDGNMQMNFPAGNSTKFYRIGNAGAYRPLFLALSNVSGTGGVLISTINGDHPNIATSTINAAKSINRYWHMANFG